MWKPCRFVVERTRVPKKTGNQITFGHITGTDDELSGMGYVSHRIGVEIADH
jgi:hypothetical protein